MATEAAFVIVGASLAGAKAAEALRQEGFDGHLVLIGDESERPYERPPLSKGYLQGSADKETIYVHPPHWYADHDVDLRLGTRVAAIDLTSHEVTIDDGDRFRYDKLVLATGSSPRRLPVPGGDLQRVYYLRRLDDCERIKAALRHGRRVVIIGAGWIGLETTAAARRAGADVTVLESAELPLLHVLGRECAQIFADLHAANGVGMRFGVQVEELTGEGGQVTGVQLADGAHISADAIVVGVGVLPNTALAGTAGLALDNGVRVDEHLRTSHPDVYAVGDAANAFHPMIGKHIRVEHWANALNQPLIAAKGMLGQDAVYDRIPYFFTDQYDLGMEYSGYVEPDNYDKVVFRGDTDSREFVAFWLHGGRVLAGMNVNVWDVNDDVQSLIRSGQRVEEARLTDPDVPLEELVDVPANG